MLDNESIAPPLEDRSYSEISENSEFSISKKSSNSRRSLGTTGFSTTGNSAIINQPKSQETLPERRNQFETTVSSF